MPEKKSKKFIVVVLYIIVLALGIIGATLTAFDQLSGIGNGMLAMEFFLAIFLLFYI